MPTLLLRAAAALSSALLLVSPASATPSPQATNPGTQLTYFPSNPAPLNYCSPGMKTHGNQLCNVFLPTTRLAPGAEYPVVVSLSLGNFVHTALTTSISITSPTGPHERFYWECLNSGIAVVQCTATVLDQLDTWGRPIAGSGIFYPPGMSFHGYNYLPYSSRKHHFCEKDAVMIMQYVRHHAGLPSGVMSTIDDQRIAVHGHSAGAFSMHWVGFGPDRSASTFPSPFPQGWETTDTRPNAVIVEDGGTWVPAFEQHTFAARHLPDRSMPTRGAVLLAQVENCVQVAASAHNYVSPTWSTPTLMQYSAGHNASQFTVSGFNCASTPVPYSTENQIHSRLSGLTWKERFSST